MILLWRVLVVQLIVGVVCNTLVVVVGVLLLLLLLSADGAGGIGEAWALDAVAWILSKRRNTNLYGRQSENIL